MSRRNVVLLKSTIAGMVGRDRLGGEPVAAAVVWLHHLSERRSGADGTGAELVAGEPNDCLAEAAEVRPGIRGQGGIGGKSGGAVVEQKGNADDGWDLDRAGSEPDDAALGAMERADRVDAAFGGGADRVGLLRRLRENHPAERRRREIAREAAGAGGTGVVHRAVFMGTSFDQQTDLRHHGSILQVPGVDGSGLRGTGADG